MAGINWNELPQVFHTEFRFGEHSDLQEGYSTPEVRPPFNIATCSAEYIWDNIRFTSKKEWFGAPGAEHLLVFRQTIEPFANCEFTLTSTIDRPAEGAAWKVEDILELDENICGYLLSDRTGRKAGLCETSLVTSFSMHVEEQRSGVDRTWLVTAFEEAPVRLEKYVVFIPEEETDYQEKIFLECRRAARMRFDDLKGRGAWVYGL